MAKTTENIGEVEDNILNEMEEIAEQVYRADPNEAVEPLSFTDFDTDLSNTVLMTIEVRGEKRNVEVLLTDEFQRIQLREIRLSDNEALREYDDMMMDLVDLSEAEAIAAEREYRKKMSAEDSIERDRINAEYNKYILLNFIVTPNIVEFENEVTTGTSLSKVPQDVRTELISAFQTANTPKEVLAKIRRFHRMGKSSGEQKSDSEQVQPSEESEA